MPPLLAGGVSAGADGGADNGGGLPVPLLPLVPVLPASLQPVRAISASTTTAMPVSAKAREKDAVPVGCRLPWTSKAGAVRELLVWAK